MKQTDELLECVIMGIAGTIYSLVLCLVYAAPVFFTGIFIIRLLRIL